MDFLYAQLRRFVELAASAGIPLGFESPFAARTAQIRINDQWRICFAWPDKSVGPIDVEVVDHH